MTNDVVTRLRRAAAQAPMLDSARETELLARVQACDDSLALEELLSAHLRLVLSIAHKYQRKELSLEDLVAEGNLGMVEAARRFDPSKGARFGTYAMWWVRAMIRRYGLANRRIIGTLSTRAARRVIGRLRETQHRLAGELGESPNHAQVAAALGVDVEDVEAVDALLAGHDLPLGDASGRMIDRWEGPTPEDFAAEREAARLNRESIAEALELLDAREEAIIRRRFLVEEKATLGEIGATLGLSRERVRQLETRARAKLRDALFDRVA